MRIFILDMNIYGGVMVLREEDMAAFERLMMWNRGKVMSRENIWCYGKSHAPGPS